MRKIIIIIIAFFSLSLTYEQNTSNEQADYIHEKSKRTIGRHEQYSILCAANMHMVFVVGGTFKMCCREASDSITVNDFFIGKYEVTQEQWYEIMGTYPTISNFLKSEEKPIRRDLGLGLSQSAQLFINSQT